MIVYGVTDGMYDDYSVVAVFRTMEDAMDYASQKRYNKHIEEIELDPPFPKRERMPGFHYGMRFQNNEALDLYYGGPHLMYNFVAADFTPVCLDNKTEYWVEVAAMDATEALQKGRDYVKIQFR